MESLKGEWRGMGGEATEVRVEVGVQQKEGRFNKGGGLTKRRDGSKVREGWEG